MADLPAEQRGANTQLDADVNTAAGYPKTWAGFGQALWDTGAQILGSVGEAVARPGHALYEGKMYTPEEAAGTAGVMALPVRGAVRSVAPVADAIAAKAAERAEAQGFNTQAYHVSQRELGEVKPRVGDMGLHLASTPEQAEEIAKIITNQAKRRGEEVPEGLSVYPVKLRAKNPVRLEDPGRWAQPSDDVYGLIERTQDAKTGEITTKPAKNSPLNAEQSEELGDMLDKYYTARRRQGFRDHQDLRDHWIGKEWFEKFKGFLARQGFDSAVYKNAIEGKGTDSYIAIDPTGVRSKFAKFDPAKKDSSHISAMRSLPMPTDGQEDSE